MTGNTAQFGAANGIGYRFSAGASSQFTITGNTVTDNAGGATGMLFDSLTGPSTLTISNNTLDLSQQGGATTQGVIFTSITDPIISGTTYYVTLQGTQNNVVQNATVPFSVPAGTTTGSILINNTPEP